MDNSQIVEKKRILYVITKSMWGGAQRYVFDLATHIPTDQFDVAVACGASSQPNTDTLVEKLQKMNICVFAVRHFQKSINPVKDIAAFFELFSVCKKFGPDVIHVNSSKAGGIAGLAALYYQLIARKPVKRIFTLHGWAFLETWRPRWQRFAIHIASAVTFLLYQKIIVVSAHDYNVLLSHNITAASKVILIHNGIGNLQFLTRLEAQKELFGTTHLLVIGSIAEWTKNKGSEYLIAAMPAVLEKFPEAILCLIGWGEERSKLKVQSVKLQLEKEIYFISKSPAAQYLNAFDMFVLPSLKEGLPYTILEAGLAELPVVATHVGGVPDIIENEKNGLLVEPASAEQLAKAIITFLQNKNLRDQTGNALRKRVDTNFSLSAMVQKTTTLYHS
ncbi:MAG: WbwZ [Parcubacteria group bacterium Gr01-1014_70]|nr:MAG: WbwZ [Parcubacteria group bacterium Gr01-1014_70]